MVEVRRKSDFEEKGFLRKVRFMSLSYRDFNDEAEKYCKTEGIATERYTGTVDREKLHLHMHSYVAKQYSDAKEIVKVCKEYEQKFWKEHFK